MYYVYICYIYISQKVVICSLWTVFFFFFIYKISRKNERKANSKFFPSSHFLNDLNYPVFRFQSMMYFALSRGVLLHFSFSIFDKNGYFPRDYLG